MKAKSRKLAALALAILQISCGYPGIPRKPSLNVPQPPNDLRAIRKSDKVYLSWTIPTHTADHLLIHHLGNTKVCRTTDNSMTKCKSVIGVVPSSETVVAVSRRNKPVASKRTAEFIDTIPLQPFSRALDKFRYAVQVENRRGRSGGLSNVPTVPAAPTLPAPAEMHAEVTARGVELKWGAVTSREKTPDLTFKYRVYRREGTTSEDTMAGESPLEAPTLLDSNIEWEKVYSYRVNVVTVITPPDSPESQVEGDDSAPIQIFTRDVFPPAVPTGVQAVFSGVGQQPFVDLVWRPDSDPDLAGYNIYRREGEHSPQKINPALVNTPAYRDSDVLAGTTYFYSVSAVDVRGNESSRSPEASEAVPR